MDDLLSAMQIIDRNSDKLKEGDYLQLCNILKKAYNQRSDTVYFFDYENFTTHPIGTSEYELRYFYDYYFDRALSFDSDYLQGQIQYLRRELSMNQPIHRISKNIRETVSKHYALLYDVSLEDIELDGRKKEIESICKSYIQIENDFRRRYCIAIEKKLDSLEHADEHLDEV